MMIKELFKNWNFMRAIRMAIGIGFGYHAIVTKDYLLLAFAGLFILQALLNFSICGAGGCSTPPLKEERQTVYKGEIQEYKK